MAAHRKGYRGIGMEGTIATWYAKNTGRDLTRFKKVADEVQRQVPVGARILEIAPGPGFCAIEIARTGRYDVTGLDISESFVRIAREHAASEGVEVDFRQGNASAMPFEDGAFDFVTCHAAFKNFTDPVGALNEMHRVLKPGGTASIYDLRKDASLDEIDQEVQGMNLSPLSAVFTKWTFRLLLLRRAYHRDALRQMAMRSRFGGCDIVEKGIGLEMRCKS